MKWPDEDARVTEESQTQILRKARRDEYTCCHATSTFELWFLFVSSKMEITKSFRTEAWRAHLEGIAFFGGGPIAFPTNGAF